MELQDDGGSVKAELLFVDDEPNVLHSLRRIMHRYTPDWNCTYAGSAEEALLIIEGQSVDLVTADISMPGDSGFDLLRHLKKHQFYADLPVLILTGNQDASLKSKALDLGAADLISKPISQQDLLARIRTTLREKKRQEQIKHRNQVLDRAVRERTRELELSRLDLIWRLARAAECHDRNTGNHIVRVAHYSLVLARNLELPEDVCQRIFQASPLHDIGKIGVSDRILLKPGPLDSDERVQIEDHCRMGAALLARESFPLSPFHSAVDNPVETVSEQERNPFLDMAAEIALSHHEHWDGRGYPNGLCGEAIPLSARICAVADVYDALTTARPYKPALEESDVLKIMRSDKGQHFDPDIFDCFEQSLDEFRAIRERFSD